MSTEGPILERLERDVRDELSSLAERVTAQEAVRAQVGSTRNDAFPMRLHLSVHRSAEGDELAIMMSAKSSDDGLVLEVDLLTEGGAVVAEGPSRHLPPGMSNREAEEAAARWTKDFQQFLVESEETLLRTLRKLD
ncbi:MAG: hypothetical protein AAF533_24725 [Acidobacteriota bacterium]